RVTEAMVADGEVGIVGHGITIVHRDGTHQTEVLREGFRFRANTVDGAKLFRRRGAFLGTSRMTIRREVLKIIGPVPESIRVQADEYLFTLAAALGYVKILEQALTFYRLHEFNAFQTGKFDFERERYKQRSLAALVTSLTEQLERCGIDKKARTAALAYSRAASDRLRLAIEGGWPWETVSAEWRIFSVSYPEASFGHRIFKSLSLVAAIGTSPKRYYRVQRSLSESDWYRRARAAVLPNPRMPHLSYSVESPREPHSVDANTQKS
ncbi:MAG: hypothetical protein ACRD5K_19680, partial [Candidatus Acidiferrales bacterium]